MSARVGEITLPVRKIGEREIAPLRVGMLSIEEIDAEVQTGGGLGNDGVWVRLDHDFYFITGRELLAAVLRLAGRTDDADCIPGYPEEGT